MGYVEQELAVKVASGQTLSLPTILLKSKSQRLDEVEVTGEGFRGYTDKKTEYVARMPLKNIENPQVYNVIPKELLQEQVALNIEDAATNAAGVAPQIWPSGAFFVNFRGFSIAPNARNGMETVAGRSSMGLANIERIEVLKGPSGTLFGSAIASFGGLVNVVTKRPYAQKSMELSYTNGSFDLNRFTADINTPLNEAGTVLFRLNTALHKENSFLDYGFNNRLLVAPSLIYNMSDRLSFSLDAELFNQNSTRRTFNRYAANSGITSVEDIRLDYRTALFHDDADAKTSTSKVFIEAKYRLSDQWTSTTLFSFVGEEVAHSYQYYAQWLSPARVSRSVGIWGPAQDNITNLQQNINGEFSTGSIAHKLLIGANYRAANSKSQFNAGWAGNIDIVDVSKEFKPLRKRQIDKLLVPGSRFNQNNDYTLSGYVSDVVQFTNRLSAMLSLRVDHFNRRKSEGNKPYQQTALVPKLGLVYQLVKDKVSLFGNYMSGFQNQAPSAQPDGTPFVPDPVYANQFEGGMKVESADKKLSATLSYYDITINNAVRRNADNFSLQDGAQKSKGLDVELIANPVQGLNILAGYAYNNNSITRSSNPKLDGKQVSWNPQNVGNLWVSYHFQNTLKGMGLGFGANYAGLSYNDNVNTIKIPGYTVFKASVFYDKESWRLGLRVNNLTNRQYTIAPQVTQPPRNFALSLTLKL